MPSDLSRSAIHTFTTKPWTLSEACERYAAAGIAGISVWRQHLESVGIAEAARIITASGLAVPALVRGGFFTSRDAGERQRAVDDNRGFLDEAATLGADQVVLVVGATPGLPLAEARQQVQDGIGALLDHAAQVQVKLAIEPLHPMYAGDKSCINSMTTARAIWEALPSPWLGVAVDVYHVWFDERLADEIARASAADKIFGFHVCDWKCDTNHLLTDRGLMGEGCIDIAGIRALVEATGFDGFNEVEIFSERHWARDQQAYLDDIVRAYRQHV